MHSMGRIIPVGRASRYAELVAQGVIRPAVESGNPLEMRAFSVANWGSPDVTPSGVTPTDSSNGQAPETER